MNRNPDNIYAEKILGSYPVVIETHSAISHIQSIQKLKLDVKFQQMERNMLFTHESPYKQFFPFSY